MDVLRHGNIYKEIECGKCGALLSYSKFDIRWHVSTDYYNGDVHKSKTKYIVCPECEDKIVVKYYIDGVETEYPNIKIK